MKLARATFAVALLAVVAAAQGTSRVSVDSAGMEANRPSYDCVSMSSDGQIVAFYSDASNLVAGDTNGTGDVFVHDRSTGITERASVDSAGAEGNYGSGYFGVSISADGQIVVFHSWASNLVASDTNGVGDIFVHDRSTGITERVSVNSAGVQGNNDSQVPRVSADGNLVAFQSYSSNLVAGDKNRDWDVFVRDRSTGLTERVSVDAAGTEGNDWSVDPSVSADGRFVAFVSAASNLVAGDTNGLHDVFVHDRSTGVTELVSVDASGSAGNGFSYYPSISADGQIVAFTSGASTLVAVDTNDEEDVFVRDRSSGLTARVSVDSSGAEGNNASDHPSISADSRFVAFASIASNLVAGDTNLSCDIFVHDQATGLTERASVDWSGAEGNADSRIPAISEHGHVVTFESYASNLVTGDTNACSDVFVHERSTATWSNYGAGFPGTNGVPSLTAQAPPVLGSTLTLDLGNSWGTFTNGLVFYGFQRATIPSVWGGTLLVLPVITELVGVDAGGRMLGGVIPNDPSLLGATFDIQAIELDPGAARGVSFTPGLELVFGY